VDQAVVVQIEQALVLRAQEFVDKVTLVEIQNQVHLLMMLVVEVEVLVQQELMELLQVLEQVEQV
jgi:hypothetical protein